MTRFVKLFSYMLILCLMVLNVSFASVSTSLPLSIQDQIEIISPEISQKGDVWVDKTLLLSMRIQTNTPIVMTLTKVEDSIVNFDKIAATKTTPFTLNSPQIATVEKMKTTIVPFSALEWRSSEEELKLKKQIFDLYQLINQDYNLKRTQYDTLLNELKVKYGTAVVTIASDKSTLDLRFPQLIKSGETLKLVDAKYKLILPLYNKLFERPVLYKLPLKLEGIMPYFNYEVKDIKAGNYRMDFYSADDQDQSIKTASFELKNKQDAVLGIINALQEELDDLWKIKK